MHDLGTTLSFFLPLVIQVADFLQPTHNIGIMPPVLKTSHEAAESGVIPPATEFPDSRDPEATSVLVTDSIKLQHAPDIEHVPVDDDPRQWSPLRKHCTLALISSAAMIAGLANTIQNPAVKEMELDLPATSAQFSMSLAIFILVQGVVPLAWSAISEIKGRRLVYLVSLTIFAVGSIVVAVSQSIHLVIGFRAFQAAGSSAVIAIGAATLADIFEPAERGTKMGIFYIAPLLGPALGPIFGGALTTGFDWRAIFWFMTAVSGLNLLSFLLFFKDTFRKERSLTYQSVLRKRTSAAATSSSPCSEESTSSSEKAGSCDHTKAPKDLGKATVPQIPSTVSQTPEIKLTLLDVSPIRPLGLVMRRRNNLVTLFASGLLFAFGLIIPYTSARTLSKDYDYDALHIGLVTLSYGCGCVGGSVLGGRWSDHQLARSKRQNGGVSRPEMRLRSITAGVILLPPFTIAFGWVCQQRAHVSALCVFLFGCGFLSIWTYSSTLAYIVDANAGRSSSAVALNSAFRGITAFVAIEVAVPMQDTLGDGWMYTIWGGIMAMSGMLTFLVLWKGGEWRERAIAAEKRANI